MLVIDVSFEKMDVDWVVFQCSSDARAHDIDDTRFWNDEVIWAERVWMAIKSEEGIVFSVVGNE